MYIFLLNIEFIKVFLFHLFLYTSLQAVHTDMDFIQNYTDLEFEDYL